MITWLIPQSKIWSKTYQSSLEKHVTTFRTLPPAFTKYTMTPSLLLVISIVIYLFFERCVNLFKLRWPAVLSCSSAHLLNSVPPARNFFPVVLPAELLLIFHIKIEQVAISYPRSRGAIIVPQPVTVLAFITYSCNHLCRSLSTLRDRHLSSGAELYLVPSQHLI